MFSLFIHSFLNNQYQKSLNIIFSLHIILSLITHIFSKFIFNFFLKKIHYTNKFQIK